MPSQSAISGDSPAKMDFRAIDDDAWYSVRVVLDGDVLRLRYCGFSDEHDQAFKASDFKSWSEVDNFEGRFRPASIQVQDSECSKVLQGDVVCASFSFQDDDVRFYDALVEGVEYREHACCKQGGEEECLCTFILLWIHGPNAGNLTSTSIESICKVQSSAQIYPKVDSFLKIARERFLINWGPVLSSKGDGSPDINHKQSFLQCLKQETSNAQLSVSKMWSAEGSIGNHLEMTLQEDTDFGGVENRYVILLENLDKDLSPSMVSKFIHRETFISPQVYIFPNLTSDPSTRGALMLDCEKKFQELNDFLDSPNHIILSSRGRPWVIIEKMSGHNIGVSIEIQMLKSQRILPNGSIESSNEFKVVYLGTEEYQKAKLLKDLFVEFFNHQKQLRKRLALDVGKILQLHHAV